MSKIIKRSDNLIRIPQDFLQRRHYPSNIEYWLDERDGDLILHPLLPDARKLYIEATTGCNLQCRTCIRNVWSDPIAQMSKSTFQNIVEGLKYFPEINRVVFTSFGEPLTHPHIIEMIEAIRSRGIPVTVGTNGVLLNAKIIRELIRLGVDKIMVSVDGGKPETYADIRGTSLRQIIENIQLLNALKKELNSLFPAVGIEFVIMKSNMDELPDVARLAAQLNISRLLISNLLPYTEDMLPEVLYGYAPSSPIKASGWAVKADAWMMWANQELPRMHWGAERRCRFVQNKSLVIGWDGAVSPCYALSHNYSYYAIDGIKKQVSRYILGSVNQQSLLDIWTSEEFVCFRSEVNGFHFPSCPDCDLRETCDLRLQNEGCWGRNPSCADCLWAQDIIQCP